MKVPFLKKTIFSLAFLAVSTSVILAQGPGPRKGDHPRKPTREMVMERATKAASELGLNESQTKQFVEVQLKDFEKRENLHQANHKAMKEKMDALDAAESKELQNVLTKEQLEKFKAMKNEHRKRHPERE